MHLISPARSMPFGSERSHFAHSPHLLASLILLIPPEIGGELKRKARSRSCGPGFCCAGSRGTSQRRAAQGPSPSSPSQRAGVGGRSARPELGGSAGFCWFRACRQCRRGRPGSGPAGCRAEVQGFPSPWAPGSGPPPIHAPPGRRVTLQLISLHAIYHL